MMIKLARILLPLSIVFTMLMFPAASEAAPAPPDPGEGSRFIISFRQPPGLAQQSLLRSLGGGIQHTYRLIPAIAVSLPEGRLSELARSPLVSKIERDGRVYAVEAAIQQQTLPWGVDRIDAEIAHSYNKGAGVKVAVIDTGIDLDHPDLSVAGGIGFINGMVTGGDDDNGHGSHVAGIIAALDNSSGVVGVAPESQLYAVKVLDRNGSGYWSDVIRGIEWAADNGMQVINMSLGASSAPTALKDACDRAQSRGLLLIAAAGNAGNRWASGSNVIYPAAYSSVIAVAATDSSNARAVWSSTGSAVELAAPGVDIYSTYKGGGYATLSGTSMASPHVAGTAALVISSGVTGNSSVRSRLTQTADDLGTLGRDPLYGYGLVNARRATPPPPPPNNPPVARAGGPYSGTEDQSVAFDGSASSDPDGDALTYSWSFGDGATGQGVTPAHAYAEGGIYTVTLTVRDGKGGESSDQTTTTIAEKNDNPIADAGDDQTLRDSDNDGQESVTLDGSGSRDADGSIVSYEWTEGDTTLGTRASISISLSVSGSPYNITLRVTDNQGASDTDTTVVTVLANQPPVAEAGPNRNALVGEVIAFNGSGSSDPDGTIVSYAWDFGDGASATGVSTSHAYAATGNYTVTLTVTDNGGTTAIDTATVIATTVPLNLMHVSRIDMSLTSQYLGWKTYASATVTVVDARGAAVPGVAVAGHWENATRDRDQGTTGTQGQVSLLSDSLRRPSSGVTFTFVIDSLTKAGWTYDPAANAETRDSVAVP